MTWQYCSGCGCVLQFEAEKAHGVCTDCHQKALDDIRREDLNDYPYSNDNGGESNDEL